MFDGKGKSTASNLHRALSEVSGAAFPDAFFSWLGWALLVICVVLAILAISPLPSPASEALRAVSLLAGVTAAAATFAALTVTVDSTSRLAVRLGGSSSAGQPAKYALHHSGVGAWMVMGGYVVIAVAGLFGPTTRDA